MIHSDFWGIALVISHAQYKYFITFIDDYSRFTLVYFLRSKAEAFTTFKFFHAFVQTQFSSKIKILCSDNGGNTHLIYFKNSCRKMAYYLKGHVFQLPNKTG